MLAGKSTSSPTFISSSFIGDGVNLPSAVLAVGKLFSFKLITLYVALGFLKPYYSSATIISELSM